MRRSNLKKTTAPWVDKDSKHLPIPKPTATRTFGKAIELNDIPWPKKTTFYRMPKGAGAIDSFMIIPDLPAVYLFQVILN